MKIQLLIATNDRAYTDHLSRVLSEKYSESFEVTVCSTSERLENLLSLRVFDVAIIESALLPAMDISMVKLPLILWDGSVDSAVNDHSLERIQKYQRISHISSDILEGYAKVAVGIAGVGGGRSRITAVWSPAGGVGKTTVALAYAAKMATVDNSITYLDLEHFSSTSVYFPEPGKSISTVFQRLCGNVALLLKAIALKDSGSGITYFSPPDNYDDMNELTTQDIEDLVSAASDYTSELVIDLPSVCDQRVRAIIEKADTVFIVTDGSNTSSAKLQQFTAQHNLFEKIRSKTVLMANKNTKYSDNRFSRIINLPLVSSSDPVSVYKTLSGVNFG